MITEHIQKMKARLSELDPEAVARVDATSTLTDEELWEAQKAQSALFAAGKIPQEVAQWVYVTAGEGHSAERFAKLPLATRVTFLKLFGELLEMKIRLHRGR
jgi:hypothetical protein